MADNPLIQVTLTYREWNALLDSISGGTLPRYTGSREAFHAIQMQVLNIVNKERRVKHYADCHWIGKVVFREEKKEPREGRHIEKYCPKCGWQDEVSLGKRKCPNCHSNIKKTQEIKVCKACGWGGKVNLGVKTCPNCKKMRVL